MTSLKYNIKSLKKVRDKGNQWITEHTELLAAKLERIMIACNGYNKIQPIRLSKSATTMIPTSGTAGGKLLPDGHQDMDLLSRQQPQFRPCLGSQRRRTTATPISVMNKYDVRPVQLTRHPTHMPHIIPETKRTITTTVNTARNRPSTLSDDSLHWGTDLTHIAAKSRSTAAPAVVAAPLMVRRNHQCITSHQHHPQNTAQMTTVIATMPANWPGHSKCERHRRADCEAMISQINRACAVAEANVPVNGGRRRKRQLLRQRTLPAQLR